MRFAGIPENPPSVRPNDSTRSRWPVVFSTIIGLAGIPVELLRAGELVDDINPMIGASTSTTHGKSGHGLGKTFPGAATPFGMVQLSPDTITGGDNGPGYSYHQDSIEGFSFTHMSGIGWYGDLGNFQMMPTTGPLEIDREKAKSPYSHDDEVAKAGYYAVGLKRYGIRAELTAAPHAGIARFTFPASETSRIQIDLARRIGMNERWIRHGRQHIEVVDDHTIQGWIRCVKEDGGWGHGEGKVGYTHHFHARFSKPISKFGVWDKDKLLGTIREYEGGNVGFFVEFPTQENETVMVKSGVSYVSVEGARKNMEHDLPAWDFDRTRAEARALWGGVLDRVAVEGGSRKDRVVFATALYHAFIDPRGVSDVDGWYVGADGGKHQSKEFVYRSIFSGWDVFRSEFPMLNLVRPDVVNDEVNSLIQMAELSGKGYLPRWELLNSYSGCMIGDPAVAVVSSAYLAGIRGYDSQRAYTAVRNSVLGDKNERQPDYARLGYATDGAGLSKTLEYACFDSSAARFAKAMGKSEDARVLSENSQNYKKVYCDEVSNMRARKADGSWIPWRERTVQGQNCVESNPYQQGWFVPHDVNGLINLMGGNKRCLALLEPFFDKVPEDFMWNDYYNHANEPVHHVPYLFAYLGKPWLTQKWVRRIMDKAYGPDVMGLVGNEDVGQMSAWLVLSAMGFHPVDTTTNRYLIGSPLFSKLTMKLDPRFHQGGTFTVVVKNQSTENVYIQSATLNGKPFNRAWISHSEIVQGGVLEFEMGPEPKTAWGLDPDGQLPSLSPRLVCQEASVKSGGDGGYIATARIQGVGGEMKSEFPVSIYSGTKNLGSKMAAVGPGENVTLEIPFSLPGSSKDVPVPTLLDHELMIPDTEP